MSIFISINGEDTDSETYSVDMESTHHNNEVYVPSHQEPRMALPLQLGYYLYHAMFHCYRTL